jgi:hypothetical protein
MNFATFASNDLIMDIHLHIDKLILDVPNEKIDFIVATLKQHTLTFNQIQKDMATLEEKLTALQTTADEQGQQITDLQTTQDTFQAGLATAISSFEATIADLQAQIANGGLTPAVEAAFQAVADKFTANNAALSALKTDITSTPLA